MTWILYYLPNWLLSRPFDLILSMCTQLTPFKTIRPNFITVYPIDTFQDHMTWFLHCIPNWLFSRPYDLIFALYTHLTPFKTIWPNFINVYPIDFFQDHMNWFLHCVPNLPNWLLSRPYDLIFALYTQLSPFKTIWPNFIIVYPIDSFQDHMTWFLYCIPNWLLSRPFDLILSMCTQLTPFKTISPDFYIVYPICPINSFQDHLTWFLHSTPNWLLSRPYDLIFVLCT